MLKNLLYIGNKLSAVGKTPTGIEILGPLLEAEGYTVRYASAEKRKLKRLLHMLYAIWYFRNSTDFVLIDTYSTSNFWYAYLCARWSRYLNLRYIPILHGGNLPTRVKRNPVLSRSLFGYAYRNVAPSNYLFTEFQDKGFPGLLKIPNPVPTTSIPYLKREKFSPRLLWVRSLADLYNPFMAVEVIANLMKEFPDATLCMVGPDAGLLAATRQLADSLRARVTFTGRLSKAEWMQLSQEYDFFINTSNIDNTPFSLLEAAALGLSIVSTNAGGIPYLFPDKVAALLVERNAAHEMADAIREAIAQPEATGKRADAARGVALSCDWQVVGAKWWEILR